MEQMKYEPIVYKVYNELKLHKGKDNAISCLKLAQNFYPEMAEQSGMRVIKRLVNIIRNSPTFDNVIAYCNNGYYWVTAAEAKQALAAAYKHAITAWKTLKALDKKIELNGQTLFKLTPYQREAIDSLCEV